MGEKILGEGFFPPNEIPAGVPPDMQLDRIWAAVSFHAHRFGTSPIAEVLVSWTTIMLISGGYHPTIGDIARATGLPRPTVSRYIKNTVDSGWAEERVNVQDRRRRELYMTENGWRELGFIVEYFKDMYQFMAATRSGESGNGTDLLERMTQLSERLTKELK